MPEATYPRKIPLGRRPPKGIRLPGPRQHVRHRAAILGVLILLPRVPAAHRHRAPRGQDQAVAGRKACASCCRVIAFAFMPRAPKTFGDKCVDAIRENIHKTGLPWARHDGPMVKDIIDREYAKLHPAKDCSDEEWLASLEANPAYQGLDVRREYEKCRVWTQTNKRQMPTKRRFLNWLNKAERPMVPQSS